MKEKSRYNGLANLMKGKEAVGGILYITDKELIHKPHKLNIQAGEVSISLQDIEDIITSNTAKVIPNGLSVTTEDGTVYKFVVYKRKKWLAEIETCRSEFPSI